MMDIKRLSIVVAVALMMLAGCGSDDTPCCSVAVIHDGNGDAIGTIACPDGCDPCGLEFDAVNDTLDESPCIDG
jgi:hypothetical protein